MITKCGTTYTIAIDNGFKITFYDIPERVIDIIKSLENERKELSEMLKSNDRKYWQFKSGINASEKLILEDRLKKINEYVEWHIEALTDSINDYIDDDRIGNREIISELKEEREHYRDVKRLCDGKYKDLYMKILNECE